MDNKIPRMTQQVSKGRKLFWVERLSEEDKTITTKASEVHQPRNQMNQESNL
jgi:hypothetical protein